jgi:hypothetical protein
MTTGAHEAFVEHQTVAVPSDRKFGFTVGACFVALAIMRLALGHSGVATALMMGGGVILILLAVLAPRLLGPFNLAWMKLGMIMAKIVNPLFMLAMFIILFTPMAVIMRMCGRDALVLRRKPHGGTYWHECGQRAPASERLKQQF